MGCPVKCRYRTVSGGLENVFELLARVRKAGTGTPKLFELSVADRKYNKPERDRAKRSGLRIFMLGRMFLPKTLRHDRTHRQEVLMTSVRAVSISRKVFVLPVVREKSEPILFSRFERLLRFGQACGAGTHGIGHRLPGFRRGFGASARPLACLLVRLGRPAPDGRQRAEVEAALTFPLASSTRASRSVRGGGSEKICHSTLWKFRQISIT